MLREYCLDFLTAQPFSLNFQLVYRHLTQSTGSLQIRSSANSVWGLRGIKGLERQICMLPTLLVISTENT